MMPDFTDRHDEQIGDNRVAIAEIQTWRTAVNEKLDEILDEVRKNNSAPPPPASTPVSDLALSWKIALVAGTLAVLGGSLASVADLLGGSVP